MAGESGGDLRRVVALMQRDFVDVNCWCEDRVVSVAREDMLKGITYPCRNRKCMRMAFDNGLVAPSWWSNSAKNRYNEYSSGLEMLGLRNRIQK